ncbi:DUF5985 family protein [Chthonobacter rhizosphaerae]|uniref:DUF5985 family protein n=1 Tax=Chthonobacter rhizosphaerae TaxID=2735553 RepID=UPI001AEE3EEC|nr:DUF5985 family protein [Chthonobacter rhizosphaerae]
MIELVKVAIYVLCFGTAAACAGLLVRGYLSSRVRLLLWSGVSFFFLAVNSLVVVLDLFVFPDLNLLVLRYVATLLAVGVLIFGLVWESA